MLYEDREDTIDVAFTVDCDGNQFLVAVGSDGIGGIPSHVWESCYVRYWPILKVANAQIYDY